jgi:hypothetical protein
VHIRNTEFTLSLLFFMFIIVMIITITNYNYTDYQLSKLYIHAEPNENNKADGKDEQDAKIDKEEQEQTKEKDKEKDNSDENGEQDAKIDKEEQEQTKEKDNEKDKEKDNSDEKEDSDFYGIHPDYRSFFPIKRIVIPDIYQSLPNGETYRFNITHPNDKFQVNKEDKSNVFTKQNYDGSWRIDFGKPRIDIHTKDAGILPDKLGQLTNLSHGKIQSWDYSELSKIGYWYKPTDWKNIEVTLIFKLLDSARSKGDQHSISIVTRSISHSQLDNDYKKGPKFFCGGSSYHNNISNEGQVRMKKEQFHIDYEWERYNDEMLAVGNLHNKIVGFKGIVYNINNTAVKLEAWVDTENGGKGPYKKIHQAIDNGNWGDNMKLCGAETNGQAITWGSPTVIIKANDFKFDIYDIEVKEIVPPTTST